MAKNTSSDAGETSSTFRPFVSDSARIPEIGWVPILTGVVMGIVFGASSLYLALKIGMTVSASIPVAVLSVTLFRAFSKAFGMRSATILENNIVQTTGSAGESIAFGVAVTIPALLIMGYEMDIGRTLILACLGSLLGVLLMIPLRQALIVKEHGKLIYPEGTACAEVLISGERGGTTAATVFTGLIVGAGFKFLNLGAKLWKDSAEKAFSSFKGSHLAVEISPELLGVGYIIGPRTAALTWAGGILSNFVLIPMIYLFGTGLQSPLFPATKKISDMGIHEIWKNYILYIGAGAVAGAGIISLVQSLPLIVRGARSGIGALKGAARGPAVRTMTDLPMSIVIGGSLLLVAVITFWPSLEMNVVGAICVLAFGFVFVSTSSRLCGEIGSSSNPVSGMTVATLLLTCLIFLFIGKGGEGHRVAALSVAAIVCIAAAVGGATSQDLKTGYLVGATPRSQQIGLLIGSTASALVIGFVLNLLNDASTVYSKQNLPSIQVDVSGLTEKQRVSGPEAGGDSNEYYVLRVKEQKADGPLAGVAEGKYLVDGNGTFQYLVDPGVNGVLKQRDDGTPVQKYEAPKARLMSLIIDGIMTQKLPWGYIFLGVFISVFLTLAGVNALAFAVGVYLPIAVTTPIMLGGMVRWLTDRATGSPKDQSIAQEESSPGILLSSGLIAGGALCGILLALTSLNKSVSDKINFSGAVGHLAESDAFALIMLLLLAVLLWAVGAKKILSGKNG